PGRALPRERQARFELQHPGRRPGRRRVLDHRKRQGAGDGMSKLPTPAKIGLIVAGVVLALVVGYFALISPQRSHVTSLKHQLDDTRTEIAERRGVHTTPVQPQIKVADLFRLSRAMPNTADIPGVLLQLSRVASETGITFQAITPHDPVPYGAYEQ